MANPLYENLFLSHRKNENPFLILSDAKIWTYNQFLLLSSKFSNALIDIGLNEGDRIAIRIEKSPHALAIYAACVQLGIVFLPLNPAYTMTEVEFFVSDSSSKLIICDTKNKAQLNLIGKKFGARVMTLNSDGSGTFSDLALSLNGFSEICSRTANDLVAILYTSGTTGRSKGAMISQKNLLSNAKSLSEFWSFSSRDVLLHALPIFHTHGLFVATNTCLLVGATMRFYPSFHAETLIRDMPKATTMMGVPTYYTRLLENKTFTRELVRNIRLFISGSAPLLAETHKKFEKRTGHKILERYGMTETNMITSNPYHKGRKSGSVGVPLPGVEVKITDPETGELLKPHVMGMIEVRGDNVFQGYWNLPEKTASELRVDGFFITGDLGFIDSEGYLHIVGRQKDLIISGGYNIYPKEIENFLDSFEAIDESAVIGVPHPDLGETVVAILTKNKNMEIDILGLESAMKKKLASYKKPKSYRIVESLPRNAMGKIQKNILRQRYKTIFLTK